MALASSHRTGREDQPWFGRRCADIAIHIFDRHILQELVDDGVLQELPFLRVIAVVGVIERFSDVSIRPIKGLIIIGLVVLLRRTKHRELTPVFSQGGRKRLLHQDLPICAVKGHMVEYWCFDDGVLRL